MSDEIDRATDLAQPLIDAKLGTLHAAVKADNVPFIEGECEQCGNESKRLVHCSHPKDGDMWACSPCRDKYKLTVKRR